jgi:N-acetylglucosamine-6-phosphate deacetylase
VTHTYKVMTGMDHRPAGAAAAALTCDNVMCELNADGFHVHPVAMDVLISCRGVDNVCLISDLGALAGLPDGEHEWAGVKIIKRDGVARLAGFGDEQEGAIASSGGP